MSITVMIVDDNQLLLQALCEHLEKMGYDTIIATNGKEALEKLKKEKPDIIIMDIIMPEMNGLDATKAIRSDPELKNIPVVAFTSKSNLGQWDELFNDYLIKPFDYENVIRIIENLTTKKRSNFSG